MDCNSNLCEQNQDILIENKQGVCVITLNRPTKCNAFTLEMYARLTTALNTAATDDTVVMALIRSTGRYFCTGNDLGNFERAVNEIQGDITAGAEKYAKLLQQFIAAFIDFPKPMIGAVNGPAIGIGATVLALMDTVVASDLATFHTPFTALGLSPEACSSYTLPQIMGSCMAADMLVFGRKLTAAEALQCGLVARVIPGAEFSSWVEKWVFDGTTGLINTCYPKSMQFTKHLLRDDREIQKLHEVMATEGQRFMERLTGAEARVAMTKFASRVKSKY